MNDHPYEALQKSIIKMSYRARKSSISRRKYKDLSRPAAAWTTTSLIVGKKGTALSIVLATVGCSHARGASGGCTMCSYLLDGSEKTPSSEQLIAQFKNAMEKVKKKAGPLSVKLYTSGSFLDEDEVESTACDDILTSIAEDERISEVVIESRPEYVTDATMKKLRESLGNRTIEIGIGLESSNDDIRNLCINKGFTLDEFKDAVKTARRYEIGVRAYVLLKPPFLSERDALEDALQTIIDCQKIGVSTISVNPVNVQKFTLVEYLWERGDYRPPWLWSLVELLNRSRTDLGPNMKIVCDPVASGKRRGVHNCGKCDKKITSAIRDFSLTQQVKSFENLNCACFEEWQHVLNHEEISSLVHTDW